MARLRARLPRIKPLKALTVAAFVVALIGIVANAMVFQRGHHPSPLFGLGRSIDGTSDAPPQVVAATPAAVPPVAADKTGTLPSAVSAAPVEARPPAVAPTSKAVPVHAAAAKPKPAAVGAAHPRPGHPSTAHAKAEVPVASRVEARAVPKAATKSAVGPSAGTDPLTRLLAEAAHPKGADLKASPVSKAASHRAATAAVPSPQPHRRVAATASAEGAKPAAKTE